DDAVTQYLGDWSDHVRSWTKPRDIPVLVLRYEDLLSDPTAGFTRLLSHIGVPIVEERLARAVRFSSFDEVRAQEDKAGFIEKSPSADRFRLRRRAQHQPLGLDGGDREANGHAATSEAQGWR
ncbi:MAG: sulfotransferase domain-containing protein, partial [Pseudomonadota bacterium]